MVDCGDRPICDENDENCVDPEDKTTTVKPDFDCPEEAGYFPDPKNCIKYYHCWDGLPQEHITCPIGNYVSLFQQTLSLQYYMYVLFQM